VQRWMVPRERAAYGGEAGSRASKAGPLAAVRAEAE
jgi:hypothetical protein